MLIKFFGGLDTLKKIFFAVHHLNFLSQVGQIVHRCNNFLDQTCFPITLKTFSKLGKVTTNLKKKVRQNQKITFCNLSFDLLRNFKNKGKRCFLEKCI